MSKKGIFPAKETGFNDYLKTVVPYLAANQARLAISNADLTRVNNLYAQWHASFRKSQDPNMRTTVVIAEKRDLRARIEALLRKIIADIPRSAFSLEDYVIFNKKKRDGKRAKVNAVDYAPDFFIENIRYGIHELRFSNPAHPHSKKLPSAHKLEVQLCIADKNTPAAQLNFSTYKITGNFRVYIHLAPADNSRTAYYRARYISNRGEAAVWSVIKSGVIA